jgi:NAD(P)H-dependent FMN reductase
VFVTPEYNHGIQAALKTAIDYRFAEWSHKAGGFFVGYGAAGGARTIERRRRGAMNAFRALVVASTVSRS